MLIIDVSFSNFIKYVGDRIRPSKTVFKAEHVIRCGLDGSNSEEITTLLNNDVKKRKYVYLYKTEMSGCFLLCQFTYKLLKMQAFK